jgi:Tfp pilus assembly protein FimT
MEIVIVLVIIATLTSIFIATMMGLRSGDAIDRAAQSVYDDLIYIRSRAVSANQNHRLNFTSTSQWAVQMYNGTAWSSVAPTRTMPGNTFLTNASYTNAGSNVEATPRGLFTFNNNASGRPYVVVTGTGTSKTKTVNVEVGGALEITSP